MWQRFENRRASLEDVEAVIAFCDVVKSLSKILRTLFHALDTTTWSSKSEILAAFDPLSSSIKLVSSELTSVFVRDKDLGAEPLVETVSGDDDTTFSLNPK